jgi:hypothetical protein
MFAACGGIGLVGTVVLGYAVLGPQAGIGPALEAEDPAGSTR